ncbi:tape measure protein [Rhizobium laguerreae]|uniref:tape measure protein n=1 Tax=Rhizobium laguerreae TaxID=1076926 RepID=UPI001C918861|nr:tape measure protein [Rhizobium laguerreae]MBY3231882.1 tape measure protein [Rhizobium laguerreae]
MTAIRVELQLADGSFTSGMLRAGQSLAQLQAQLVRTNPQLANVAANGGNVIRSMTGMDSSTKGFLSTLRDVSIVTGLVSMGLSKMSGAANGWVGDIVRINAEMEKLNFQMRAMATSADPMKEAADNVKYLREQATQMPFSLRTITSGFVKLKATGTDPMNGSLKAIADGISSFGGSDEAFNRTILGITQAAGKGVLQMEELRQQIGESMPNAMQLLARSMGLSVGQLAKEISTGTVASRPALEKLYDELNRVYGGTSQRMMRTFSGQLTQLHTNLQNLATNEGGSGFFDQVKGQLQDINRFLASDMANQFATKLGNALSSVVQGLRTAITTIWEFRDEITRVGVIIAGGLGMLALARGIQSTTAAITAAGFAWKIFRTNMAEAVSNITLGVTGFRNMTTATTGLSFVLMGMRGAFGAILTGFTAFAPLIVGVGVAAYTAGEYFGLFKDRVGDAYEELKKFGAESEAIARRTVEAKRNQLQERLSSMQNARALGGKGWDEQIAELQKEMEKFEVESPKFIQDAAKNENSKKLDTYKASIQDAVALQQQGYEKIQKERDQAFDEDLAKTGEHEESKAEITKKYQDDLRENQKNLSKAIIKEYDDRLGALNNALTTASGSEKELIQQQIAYINSLRNPEYQRYLTLDDKAFKVDHTSTGANETKAVNRGKKALEDLQADIAKIQANMNGASGAAAEMAEKIAANDFGSIKEGGEDIAKLHDQLMAAAEAKETLDKAMKGNQKADRDLENIQEDLREREMKLLERQQGRELNDAQKMRLRLDNGGYFALGPYDNIKKALGEVVGAMNAQGLAANQVGTVMRENTFSNETVKHVDTVTDAIGRLSGAIQGVGTSLNGLNFADLGKGLSGTLPLGGNAPKITQFSGSMLDLIAKGESGGDYNATLDNGAWTGGSQNLVGMTLKQVRDLQRKMLSNPANRAKYGDGKGSSALGKYQIVGQTLQGLMEEMGLSGDEMFDEKMQDQMAMRLLNRRLGSGEGIGGLRKEWTSLKNVSDDVIQNALNGASNGPTREKAAGYAMTSASAMSASLGPLPTYQPTVVDAQIEKTEDLRKSLDEADKKYQELGKRTNDADLADWIKQTSTETKDLGKDAEDTGKRYDALVKAITGGKFGDSAEDKNPEAARYKDAIAAAKEYDAVAKDVDQKKKLRTQTDRDTEKLEEDRLELNRRLAEAQKKVSNPDYIKDSSALEELTTRLDAYIGKTKELYGEDSDAYRQALETKTNMLRSQSQLDSAVTQTKLEKERRDTESTLLTTTQMRQQEMQRKIALIDQATQEAIAAGEDEVEATRRGEAQKAAIRAQYAQEMSPMQKQFKEWGDLQSNLAQGSARWMDSLADGIAGLVTGTGDLKQVLQGILKDIVSMGVKYMMSGMFSGKGGGAAAGGKKGGAAAAGGSKKGLVPTAHTGGIIGSSALSPKMAHAAMFAGAPKFHTGGIVDSLLPSEVPIIAKKGEGVFTPEQMDAMGGFSQSQSIVISSPITVQGSAGSPEQNQDLAKKMAREYERSMRGVVAEEIRKQTRPGNYMNQRSR